jgi:hypothetical protein
MALDLSAEYPGQLDTSDPVGYPYGRPQNVTVEGDGSGTPWEERIVSDFVGHQQALLVAAAITPSGIPDKVGASQYLIAFYRLLGRADGWGAVGDDATDDTAALQAGLAAVAALGGRREFHLVSGKIYRVTGLTVPVNVDLHLHGATLTNTHATNHLLTYSAATGRQKQKITNGTLVVAGGSGSVVRVQTAAVQLICDNVNFRDAPGKYIDVQSSAASARVHGVECVFENHSSEVHVDFAAAGVLVLERCRSISGATRTNSLVRISAAANVQITRHEFELTSHSSGTMACIEVTSAGAVVHLTDNEFLQDTDPAVTVALKWTAAAKIIEKGTSPSGNITPYDGGSVVLADGSSLDLRQHGEATSSTETYTLPDDYRSFSLAADYNTFPIDITMPKIRYLGQEYDFQLYNKNATDWATDVTIDAMGPSVSSAGDPIEGGNIRTGRFRVMRNDFGSNYRWTLVGAWSEQYVRGTTIGA